jgi:hypothetical protein
MHKIDETSTAQQPTTSPEASPFDEIVDDVAQCDAAVEWAREQVLAGRTVEAISAELVEQGWEADEVEGMVEAVRKLTRAERGIVTREHVSAVAARQYRNGSGGWIVAFPTLAAARRLLHALASVKWLGRIGRRE